MLRIIVPKPSARAEWSAASGPTSKNLWQIAFDYDDIAEDLETGAVEIRHPELMPQNRR